jgi:predicted nucleic acid-binding protein
VSAPALLIDNSAWARLQSGAVAPAMAEEIADGLDSGRIAVCLPFILEAGYSARNLSGHDELYDGFAAFAHLAVDKSVEVRALGAQAQLARSGHRRMPPNDLMIAALADRHEVGVLHYDSDYDLLLERTDLEFESEWLAPRGTL